MDAHGPPSVALTSLLNSLHTHLQSQTQLLPTLHAQLGLPTTAIEDELTALQQQLAECVEARVDVRRKQVDEWMGRCDEVERVCVRYCAALGAHVKVAGSSVGERRKEMVLPRRYQMVSEYQEKLRQVSIVCKMRARETRLNAQISYITRSSSSSIRLRTASTRSRELLGRHIFLQTFCNLQWRWEATRRTYIATSRRNVFRSSRRSLYAAKPKWSVPPRVSSRLIAYRPVYLRVNVSRNSTKP